jgi:deoxyribodipyrimidine photolyase-related protein
VLLPRFGTFQDAMTDQSEHKWSLYHSRLSFSLNAKLLSPREVVAMAIDAYRGRDDISLSQVEGFVRQILGWREFIRGIYWLNMPEYQKLNYLEADRPLPEYFWSGETQMNCMSEAINQSLDYAFAHHIQRLMVTGTFSLLAGIDPDQVDDWYLGIYLDAIEWVELPNTRGMSQFADGGLVGTKPYSASGNYINKMSDYCKGCRYKVSKKTGSDACPFNSLYWHFMHRHRPIFEKNPRIGMVYRNWDKQSEENRNLTLERAEWCLEHLDEL